MVNPDNIFGRLGNRMFQMAYIYAQVKRGQLPDIYCQDPELFDPYEKDIKNLYGDNIGYLSQVSIAVRRTDYVNNSFYVDLTKTDYYEKAIAMFPDDQFLVFSDDPDFCKSYSLFQDEKRFQIMEMTGAVEDMNLMASCKDNIIANSTFSWWGAFLNPNWGKRVVAPSVKNWYTDGVERTKCPKDWIRI